MEQKEKQQIVGELEALQLEETRDRVTASRAARAQREANARHMATVILRNKQNEKATQEDCWHKKGGRGLAGLNRGEDPKFAVAKYQLAHGPIIVICQRCGIVWKKPAPLAKGYSTEERKQYMLDLAEYNKALNLPTDNTMGGGQLFMITQAETVAA